ncbi:MAG: patatin-like phospholipase family protein, partial [Ruminococcus sp.]|nr:patatin-like phospholipase family protein [Ruminococcus sp.]
MSGKIGLVLSGGGAKGAYEIGVYKALSAMGAEPYIDTIAGTSVGALNAVLLDSR